MSRCKDLPNDLTSAKNYVSWLGQLEGVDEVWLQGSRSPLRSKQVHDGSDWDLAILTKIDKYLIIHPRKSGQLCADLCITNDRRTMHPKAVIVYPKDEHGVFKDVK